MKRSYKNFEESFVLLLEKAKAGTVTLETFLKILSGHGRLLLLIFLSLGFGQIPGISFFLGLMIGYLGIKIAVGTNYLWMPEVILHRKVPSYLLIKVLSKILRLLQFIKRWSHPCYLWFARHPTTHKLNGFMIAFVGLSFALSPPIPLTGLMGFVAIILIAIGILNEDGIYIILGYACAIFYLIMTLYLLNVCSVSRIVKFLNSFKLF